jgi:oligopeptide/dipeptide ABC transporter ATP-binding protein
MLNLVHIPDAGKWLTGYPHEMSGGMRQRVMIAMALACDPKVLIADEPTTALDVTIQSQVLKLIRELQEKMGTAVVMITHDLGVIAETADRVVVMYAGRKVEEANVNELFANPRHPYTVGLMTAIPRLDKITSDEFNDERLTEIPGVVPPLYDLPQGCAFASRCSIATDNCRQEKPDFEEKSPGHWAACFEEIN